MSDTGHADDGDIVAFGPPIATRRIRANIAARRRGAPLIVPEDFDTGHADEGMTMQEWVKRLRDHAHWTQVDLAYHLRVSPATIARWESGKAQPHALTRDALTRLARKQKFVEPLPD